MAKGLTDEQVEQEIARLQQSPYVKLANQERRMREKRRMYLYGLRQLEKKGMELERAGITPDVLRSMYNSEPEYDCAEYRSPPEKYPTGRPLQYNTDKNPLAGSHWFDRAMADHSKDVLKEAQNAADCGSYP